MLVSVEEATGKIFDYVVIGAGAAGLTLAAHLSEDTDVSVLVIEAGPANLDDPSILRPASYGSNFGNADYSWNHKTTKQIYGNEKEHVWIRGKGIGGSTSINFMGWFKPPAEEINDFEKLGNPGWNWESCQKAMSRVEGFVEPSGEVSAKFKLIVDPDDVGRTGPLKIAYPGIMYEAEIEIQQTLVNAGIPIASKPLGGDPHGVFFGPNTYDPVTHTRAYATTAYYLPNQDRTNLCVLVNAHATRVLSDASAGQIFRAIGVELLHSGLKHIVRANREVVLSAGTVRSPQLLELSGIGGRDVLTRIGVDMKVELPGVGENLQDHIVMGINFELGDGVDYDTLELLRDPETLKKHIELYAEGTGLFTTGFVSFAFTSPDKFTSNAEPLYKKAQAIYAQTDRKSDPGLSALYKIQADRLQPGNSAPGCEFMILPCMMLCPDPPEPGKRYFTIAPALEHPWSRGTVHCTSSDPLQDPELDPCYFEKDIDLDILLESAKFARSLANVPPMKDMIVKEASPGSTVNSDDEWRNWIKNNVHSVFHGTGSCSMLPRELNGVVDHNLKVYGTANLRVVDFSVVPLHFAAHPLSIVHAIAIRASDIIKSEYSSYQ